MNEYTHIEQDDLFSDEMVGKISALVAHLKDVMKEQRNPHDPAVQDIIRKNVSDFVAAESITNPQNVREIETAVIQQLSFEHHDANGEISVKSRESKKITMEQMQEIVKPNVYSAVGNYIKFVRPFTKEILGEKNYDPKKFEEEFSIFRERQKSYLREDLGIEITLRDLPLAFDALMILVSESIKKSDEDAKKKAEDLKNRQKLAVVNRVINVTQLYQEIDQSDKNAVELFWQKVAQDIEKKDGLTGADLAHAMYVFRTHLHKIREVVVEAQKKRDMQNAVAAVPQQTIQKDIESNVKETSVSGVDTKKEQASVEKKENTNEKQEMKRKLDALRQKLADARSLFTQKTIDQNDSLVRIKSFFGKDVSVGDDDIKIFREEYHEAWKEYREAYLQYTSIYGGVKKEMENTHINIEEGVERFATDVSARGEKAGGRISQILHNISLQYARISPKIKKAFVVSMVVGGIILGYATGGKHKNEDEHSIANAHDTMRYTETVREADNASRIKAIEKIVAEHAKEKELKAEKAQEINESTIAEESPMDMHKTVIVEKNSSIIGSMTKYFNVHPELLKDSGKTPSQMAFLLAQKYSKEHKFLDLNKVYPNTQIDLDLIQKTTDGKETKEIHIDNIVFVGGPHIVPEQQKIKRASDQKPTVEEVQDQTPERQDDTSKNSFEQDHHDSSTISLQTELQKVREIIADPQESQIYKKAVFERIADIFSDEMTQGTSVQEQKQFIQRIAHMSVNDVMQLQISERTKERLQSVMISSGVQDNTNGRTKVSNYLFRTILREKMRLAQGDAQI